MDFDIVCFGNRGPQILGLAEEFQALKSLSLIFNLSGGNLNQQILTSAIFWFGPLDFRPGKRRFDLDPNWGPSDEHRGGNWNNLDLITFGFCCTDFGFGESRFNLKANWGLGDEHSEGNWDLWDLFVQLWMAVRAAACADDRTKLPPSLPPNSLLKKRNTLYRMREIHEEKYTLHHYYHHLAKACHDDFFPSHQAFLKI